MKKEGIRRLSIFIGILFAVPGTMLTIGSISAPDLTPRAGYFFGGIAGAIAGYFIGLGFVRLIGWVIEGFQKDT
jgi:hypothetical protein